MIANQTVHFRMFMLKIRKRRIATTLTSNRFISTMNSTTSCNVSLTTECDFVERSSFNFRGNYPGFFYFQVFFLIVGVVLNAIELYVVFVQPKQGKNKKTRRDSITGGKIKAFPTPAIRLVGLLSVPDGAFCLSTSMYYIFLIGHDALPHTLPNAVFACQLSGYFLMTTLEVSLYIFAFIAFDRWMAIRPMKPRPKWLRTSKPLIFLWGLATFTGFVLPKIIGARIALTPPGWFCMSDFFQVKSVILGGGAILIGMGAASYFYLRFYLIIKGMTSGSENGTMKKAVEVAKKMLILTAFYAFFWSPALFMMGYYVSGVKTEPAGSMAWYEFSTPIGGTVNSALAPILDCILFPQLKVRCLQLIGCGKKHAISPADDEEGVVASSESANDSSK